MKQIDIVQDLFFGDTGKGKTVQWLCNRSLNDGLEPIVVRYNGGPQAGHRVINDDVEHIFSSFGSGSLLNVPTLLTKDVYVDPICFMNEADTFKDKKKIFVNMNNPIITPYDVLANNNDSNNMNNGSCGKGIFKAFNREKINLVDCCNDPESSFNKAGLIYPNSDGEQYFNIFKQSVDNLCHYVHLYINEDTILSRYNSHIYECSQGILLDQNYGFMPHCTPSNVFLKYEAKIDEKVNYYFTSRLYLTRHGNGYEPKHSKILEKYLSFDEPTNRNDGPQGVFKTGLLDLRLFQRVVDRTNLDNFKYHHPSYKFNLVLNHLDCFDICIPYIQLDGGICLINKTNIYDLVNDINSIFKFDNVYLGDSVTNIQKFK